MNNNDGNFSFIVKRSLKQITPYLHFQHDIHYNPGAILRATEVKPKLDRFLIDVLTAQHSDSDKTEARNKVLDELKIKNLIINTENTSDEGNTRQPALRYKMRFITKGDVEISNDTEMEIAAAELLYNNQYLGKITKARSELKRNYNAGDLVQGYGPLPKRIEPHALYFANMVPSGTMEINDNHSHITEEEKDEYIALVKKSFKETVLYKEPIELQIICMDSCLRKVIEDNLDTFFILNNFGCRQSKGFGSFLPIRERPISQPQLVNIITRTGIPYFMFNTSSSSVEAKFNNVLTVYSIMKSGINHKGYIKGFAMRKWLHDNTGSEKARIKSKILTDKNNKSRQDYDNYVFIRALLGLPDHYEFRDKVRNGNVEIIHFSSLKTKGGKVTVDIQDIINYTKPKTDRSISRFQSPITVKIFDSCVFFLFNDTWRLVAGQPFLFMRERDGKELASAIKEKRFEDAHGIICDCPAVNLISVPDEFNVKEFIREFIDYFDEVKSKLSNFPIQYRNSQDLELTGGNIDE